MVTGCYHKHYIYAYTHAHAHTRMHTHTHTLGILGVQIFLNNSKVSIKYIKRSITRVFLCVVNV